MKRALFAAALLLLPALLQAEYGDVVLNRHSDKQGVAFGTGPVREPQRAGKKEQPPRDMYAGAAHG